LKKVQKGTKGTRLLNKSNSKDKTTELKMLIMYIETIYI